MGDSREKIFAAIRRGLRGPEKVNNEAQEQFPTKRTSAANFEGLFDQFGSELKKLEGAAAVFDNEESASKFIADHAGENVFVDGGVLSRYKNLLRGFKKPVRSSSEFDSGYDRREAAVFDSAVVPCVACISETGTVVIANDMRLPAALATRLFIIAEPKSLLPSLDELFTDEYRDFSAWIPSGKGSNLFLITGPSRTADIEKELVTGVHGPKEVYVIFIKQ